MNTDQKPEQTLQLNVLPLNLKPGEQQFTFHKQKTGHPGEAPLFGSEIPYNLQSDECNTLYTRFNEDDSGDITALVNLSNSPHFTKHYLNHLFYDWFEERAYLRRKDFVNNTVLFFRTAEEISGFAAFDRYALRGTLRRLTDGPELTIMYRGVAQIWKKSILDYPGSTEDFSKVVYRKKIYRYRNFNEAEPHADREEVFPVLNRHIAKKLKLPPKKWKPINKLKRHTGKVDKFYNMFCTRDSFVSTFRPDPGGLLTLSGEKIRRLEPEAADLRFGGGFTHKDPMEGMKRAGPFKAPPASQFELILMAPEDERDRTGNQLYLDLKEGKGSFPGINRFANIPVNLHDEHITFKNGDDPLREIEGKVRKLDLSRDKQYAAFYISAIHRDDPDPKKHRVYYRLKEMLLTYGITSQVIHVDSVHDSSFNYYLPNICTALVAKLGGTPWTVSEPARRELVIGIGAYRPTKFRKTYLGTAFCFDSSGEFRGIDSFTAGDMVKLGGSFQRAISNFLDEYSETERVVLHYYKRLNREELGVLKNALYEMKLSVPLVILTINKEGSKDLVLADRMQDDRLPLSGTWTRVGERQFLLCNNTRFDRPDDKIRSQPFPVKVVMEIAGLEDEEEKERLADTEFTGELLEQVYRFSRLNWQTVTVKALPVTIAYPEMVAQKFPWFEGSTLPAYGRQSLWFL